jgi:hypothetical protein
MGSDSFCLLQKNGSIIDTCHDGAFWYVTTTTYNLWNPAWPNAFNIGGVVGAGYFPASTYEQYSSFWPNLIAEGVPTQLAISLVPNASDWDWIPLAPNFTNFNTSEIVIGSFNATDYLPEANATTLNVTSVSLYSWLFNLTEFAFGITNTTNGIKNATSSYSNYTNTTYNTALITMAHPGIGLANSQYIQFRNYLSAISGNLWNCPNGRGDYCWAPVWCSAFAGTNTSSYNYTDYNFKIIFNGNTADYLLLPL